MVKTDKTAYKAADFGCEIFLLTNLHFLKKV